MAIVLALAASVYIHSFGSASHKIPQLVVRIVADTYPADLSGGAWLSRTGIYCHLLDWLRTYVRRREDECESPETHQVKNDNPPQLRNTGIMCHLQTSKTALIGSRRRLVIWYDS